MANNRNYISLAMLPLESMAEYMEKIVGFRKKDEAAEDTKKVAGTSSKVIAVAATNSKGELVEEPAYFRKRLPDRRGHSRQV